MSLTARVRVSLAIRSPPVLLVNPPLSLMLSRYLRRLFPRLVVLSGQAIALLSNRLTLRYRCPLPHSPAHGADPARE